MVNADVLVQFVYDIFYEPILYTSAAVSAFSMVVMLIATVVKSIPE